MNPQVENWIKRPNNFVVIFKHEDIYGTICVTCTLDRSKWSRPEIPISCIAGSEEESVKLVRVVLDKLLKLDKVEPPAPYVQPHNNGYFRRKYGDQEVEFKNINKVFHITNIRKVKDDYYVLDEPLSLEDFAKNQHTFRSTGEIDNNGYEIYFYDNTFALAGDGGYVKIKDNKIYMKKSTFMS